MSKKPAPTLEPTIDDYERALHKVLDDKAKLAVAQGRLPKLQVTATATVPLYDLLQERRRQGKVIEHDSKPAA